MLIDSSFQTKQFSLNGVSLVCIVDSNKHGLGALVNILKIS